VRYATSVSSRRTGTTMAAAAFAAVAACAWLGVASGQFGDVSTARPEAEFHFARLVYRDSPYSRRGRWGGRPAWATDYADAEFHVMQGIGRFTGIDVAEVDIDGNGGRLIQLVDDSVFDYPWLYAVEVGQWMLDESEAKVLREYLDRGGFLMVDDFWGEYQWEIFVDSMQRVFPDKPIEELGEDHELLHVLYDLDQRTQIPGRNGPRPETPHWRGIFDDDGRLMVAINFNMDMGDAWEHADDPWYPEPMTALAYKFAVNYLIYTMTH
ncbi:MAG TPA: DUF4159 domain-containing protein, partial [Gammaproteobacteria bacterium]|nr:DUF4159 domain-containing protein [Gammaproteobacteria bacterium]